MSASRCDLEATERVPMRDTDKPMNMPRWWDERRYGLLVDTNLAIVPAWGPIGQNADAYQQHLGSDPDSSSRPHAPLAEVLAHHRDRWGHIDRFDDFLPLLTFENFDAETWARLAVESGMTYSVLVAKHHDGWCWWDAPNTERTVTHGGPRRNVLAEYAAACERNDLSFGAAYSLLDRGDERYPEASYVTDVIHPQITDLVTRYGLNALWGDGERGHDTRHWLTPDLLERLREINEDLVVNNGCAIPGPDRASTPPSIRTFEYVLPDDIIDEPWEHRRGIGSGFGSNQIEPPEHHLSGFDIVALLTEVVAKGGHLLLSVSPDLDGSVSTLQSKPLLDAGSWVRRYSTLVNNSVPWSTWGDEDVRYLVVDDTLHAVDISGRGRFAALAKGHFQVDSVERVDDTASPSDNDATELRFRQDDNGLQIDLKVAFGHSRADTTLEIAVYRLQLSEPERPIELFEPTPATPVPLAPLLASADPGDVVQLGDGTYSGPATVPAGVIISGLGPGRTIIRGDGGTSVSLERNARIEHLTVSGVADRGTSDPTPIVEIIGPYATVLGCHIKGRVAVRADDALIRASSAIGVLSTDATRLSVSRCQFDGTQWGVGVHLIGGGDHEIDSCELHQHLCAIRVVDATGVVIRGNNISARWWGVHLEQTERAHVHGNQISHTMRAVDVDGGTQALIEGNAVADGDSGCVVEWGAAACHVNGNRWERCRIGLLAWEATGLHESDNRSIDLLEPNRALVIGP